MKLNENQNPDQQELSRHLETLRQALEPLSDLSSLTQSSLLESLHSVVARNATSAAPATTPETPAVFRTEPAPATAPSITASNADYHPALNDPELVLALLKSRLSAPAKPSSAASASSPVFETFARQSPAAVDVELKPRDLPLKSKAATPILRERPPRGHGAT